MSTIALICWKINCIRTYIIISYLFKALPLYVVWWFLKVYEVFNIDIIIWCSPKQCFGFTSTSILTLLFFLSTSYHVLLTFTMSLTLVWHTWHVTIVGPEIPPLLHLRAIRHHWNTGMLTCLKATTTTYCVMFNANVKGNPSKDPLTILSFFLLYLRIITIYCQIQNIKRTQKRNYINYTSVQ